jgi:hypothetical protein
MNILTKFIATTAMTGGTLISLGLSSAPAQAIKYYLYFWCC